MANDLLSMPCPACGNEASKIVESGERTHDSSAIIRWRICTKCGDRFKTVEQRAPADFKNARRLLNRPPPPLGPQSWPNIPPPTVLSDGRICWPEVFEYKIKTDAATYISPVPTRVHVPAERNPNPKWLPHPRDGSKPSDWVPNFRPLGMGEYAPAEAAWSFEYLVYNLPVFEALQACGMLADPRHRGISTPQNGYDDSARNGSAPATTRAAAAPRPATTGEQD